MPREQAINPLRARLEKGEPAFGALVSMPSVHVVQTLAHAGFDWLFFDMEHGPIDIESAHAMVAATQGSQAAPIIRVAWNEHWLVKPALDTGAMGIIFPMIRSAADAEAAVRSLRYPPAGERGFGPFYAAMRFGVEMSRYADVADREVLCMALIEHRDAIDNIEAIAAVEGLDACLIAPFDLSMSYGHRDGADHQEVQEAIARAEAVLLPSPLHVGGLALDTDSARAMIAKGYRLILTGFDVLFLQRAAADVLGPLRPSS